MYFNIWYQQDSQVRLESFEFYEISSYFLNQYTSFKKLPGIWNSNNSSGILNIKFLKSDNNFKDNCQSK